MSKLMQKVYISILNPIYDKAISGISEEKRDSYVRFLFLLLQFYFILFFSKAFKPILFTHGQRMIAADVIFVLIALFSMKGPLEIAKWKKRIFIPMIMSALGVIITGLMHPLGSGYLLFGASLLIVYPCFYLVWNNRKDYETLFDIVAETNIRVGNIYFLYTLLIFPEELLRLNGERFRATIGDPNLYSLVGMAMVCSAAYMFYRGRKNKMKIAYCTASAIVGLIVVLLGQSRSGMLVCIGAIFFVYVFILKARINGKANAVKQAAAMLFITIIFSAAISAGTLPGYAEESEEAAAESTEETAVDDNFADRFSVEGKDLNTFTSGRVEIWKNYARHLNMTGNNFNEIDWTEMTNDTVKHAHNNFLEYGYRCGVPVALAFTILELFAGLMSLKYLFSRKWNRECYLFAVISMFMYAVMSLLDIATIPMERYAPFCFYIILSVMIDANENDIV